MTSITEILELAVAAGDAPGFSAAWTSPEGGQSHAVAGSLVQGESRAVQNDSLFWIASFTKAITATAALQLVERGLLNLDEPVGSRLPGLAQPQVLTGFDSDGQPQTRPARTPVTLRHLLTHTSGLGYDFCHPGLARNAALPAPAAAPLLVFEPGEGWQYGVGLDWAGQLIEQAAGQPFHSYLDEAILAPLGMTDTTFFPSNEQAPRRAGMHMRAPDGSLAPMTFAMPAEPNPMMGGGGLYSTAGDYLTFLNMILGGGVTREARILSPDSTALLTTPQISGVDVGILTSTNPVLTNDFDPFPGMPKGYGLGFVHNIEPGPAGRSAGSLAWAGLSNCYYWADPERGVAGVLLAQLLPFGDSRALDVFARFERAVYAGAAH
jgi:methyl acetate hydrolase